MCDPVSIGIATFALGATQAVATHVGMNQQYEANRQAANYNYAREQEAINRQYSQLQQEHSQQVLDTAITALKARGDISASAADMGLAPTSISHQLNASMFGLGREATIQDKNFQNQRVEIANSRTDAELKRQNQINSKPRSNAAMLALGIGNSALQGFNSYNGAKKA